MFILFINLINLSSLLETYKPFTKTQKMNTINLLQLNVGRSIASHDCLDLTARENNCDIAIIAEPNKKLSKKEGSWIADKEQDSMIKIYGNKIKVDNKGSKNGMCFIDVGDIRIVSCYASPNKEIENFENLLQSVHDIIIGWKGKLIIAGDLNAKAKEWGNHNENQRGKILGEWLSTHDLVCENKGNSPTFIRDKGKSFIDMTLTNRKATTKIQNWRVLDKESLSFHRIIAYEVGEVEARNRKKETKRYNTSTLRPEILKEEFRKAVPEVTNIEGLLTGLRKACDKAMRARRIDGNWPPVYWWNDTIKNCRIECIKKRRKFVRINRKVTSTTEEKECTKVEYANAKKELRREIQLSKDKSWKNIIRDVEQDVWGNGYKIVMKKLAKKAFDIADEVREKAIATLFPKHRRVNWITRTQADEKNEIVVTKEELLKATAKIKKGKAPGPDGIPGEALKILGTEFPEVFARVFTDLLNSGMYPKRWKMANLVLLKKQGKDDQDPRAYRPICLLDTTGKLMEQIIVGKLKANMMTGRNLSHSQYGFREGCSTIQPLILVKDAALTEMNKSRKTRKFCALVTIDIRNAFNSAPWRKIDAEVGNMGISNCLRNIVRAYLSQRHIVDSVGNNYEMTAGVPQGSVLGPHLWNILYDSVLRIEAEDGVKLLAYADDLAVVVVERHKDELIRKVNNTLSMVEMCILNLGLELAPEKTEAILLVGKKNIDGIEFEIGDTKIVPKQFVKYLGVTFDKRLNFGEHIETVTQKAISKLGNLYRILPRVGGAGERKRKMLFQAVASSIILYASPVWEMGLNTKKNRDKLEKIDRKIGLRVCRGYRTISTDACMVIAGLVPLQLQIEERGRIWRKGCRMKETEDENTMTAWQEKWLQSSKGEWTRRLIPDIKKWVRREHGETTYYMTQAMSGHGNFCKYLYRIGKINDPLCAYCKCEEDDAEHTIFVCPRWRETRTNLEKIVKTKIKVENMVSIMLKSEKMWSAFADYFSEIMGKKDTDDREARRVSHI